MKTLHSLQELNQIGRPKRTRISITSFKIEITEISFPEQPVQKEKIRNIAKEIKYTTPHAVKFFKNNNGKFVFEVKWSYSYDDYLFTKEYTTDGIYKWVSINEAKALIAQWNRPMAKHYLFK